MKREREREREREIIRPTYGSGFKLLGDERDGKS